MASLPPENKGHRQLGTGHVTEAGRNGKIAVATLPGRLA